MHLCTCGHSSPLERSCAARCALLVESCVECLCHAARLENCRALLFMEGASVKNCSVCMSRLGAALCCQSRAAAFASVLLR